MALKEIKGSTQHKIMIASGGVSTDRDEGGPSFGLILIGLIVTVVAAFAAVTAPLWLTL